MKLAGLALVLATLAAFFFLRSGPGDGSVAPHPPGRSDPTATRSVERQPPELVRDPFQYDDGRGAPAVPAARVEAAATAPPITLAAALPVRLIGFVRGDALRAALVIDGEVVLASAGEKLFGYEIIEVDEDSGVRIRDRSGETFTLIPP